MSANPIACESSPLALPREANPQVLKEVRLSVHSAFEPIASLREKWDELVLRCGSTVYMTYDWTRVWWQFYGKGKRLRIFVFHAGDELVAILPMYIECLGFWPFSLQVAKILGTNLPPHVLDPAIAPEYAAPVFSSLLERLFAVEGCDLLYFGLVSEKYAMSESLCAAARSDAHLLAPPQVSSNEVATTFHLPGTFEDYFASLNAKERKIRRKKLRDLEDAWPLRCEVVDDPALVEREFEEFAEMHTKQWQAEGRPGHFAAWPRGLDYHRELVRTQAAHRRTRFVKLYAGDVLAVNQYTFVFGDSLFAELPARVFGGEWERYSLGCTSQIKLIENMISCGLKKLESGVGHYEYKVLLNGTESAARVIRVTSKGAWSGLKLKAYQALGKLLGIFLHKIWYRRIAPRLRMKTPVGIPPILMRFDF